MPPSTRRFVAAVAALAAITGIVTVAPNARRAASRPAPALSAGPLVNLDIPAAPVNAGSAGYIMFINNGSTRSFHQDFGDTTPCGVDVCGSPYAVVDSTHRRARPT